jgi:hypothetical protein
MALIKHNKLRNTGLLFELLVRTITADALSNKNSPAVDILKKHFVKSELGKEYRLYETVFKNTSVSEAKAEAILNTILNASRNLNKETLKREKYNLIKEIKQSYNLDEFFKTKIPNYKAHAALYILMETFENKEADLNQVVANKLTLLEHLSVVPDNAPKEEILEEFKGYDKELRILTYKILLDKFNKKYDNLNENQKAILKEYINSVDNIAKLRDFYNETAKNLKKEITILNRKTSDSIIKIKLNEVTNLLKPISKTNNVKNEDVVNLLQYCELINELKFIK